ncbi:MAG: ribosome-associated translation inhibitor RaiA [Candidatus Krumholzibacteriota bacterium]|nr:ribosome-associated translation inhibitor RaiA [Candidatus Krumholzibacteriota bacterium]
MQITVTGKKLDLTPAIRSYAEEKIGRLDKFVDGVREAHVLLRVEKHRHIAEATLRGKSADFSGKEHSEDLYAAIDRLADKLESQMRKFKTRTLNRRKGGKPGARTSTADFSTGTITILGEVEVGEEEAPRPVIEEKFITLDQLTVEEAISRMEVHDSHFWVYSDAAEGRMCVVYRRSDGHYGLIQAEA